MSENEYEIYERKKKEQILLKLKINRINRISNLKNSDVEMPKRTITKEEDAIIKYKPIYNTGVERNDGKKYKYVDKSFDDQLEAYPTKRDYNKKILSLKDNIKKFMDEKQIALAELENIKSYFDNHLPLKQLENEISNLDNIIETENATYKSMSEGEDKEIHKNYLSQLINKIENLEKERTITKINDQDLHAYPQRIDQYDTIAQRSYLKIDEYNQKINDYNLKVLRIKENNGKKLEKYKSELQSIGNPTFIEREEDEDDDHYKMRLEESNNIEFFDEELFYKYYEIKEDFQKKLKEVTRDQEIINDLLFDRNNDKLIILNKWEIYKKRWIEMFGLYNKYLKIEDVNDMTDSFLLNSSKYYNLEDSINKNNKEVGKDIINSINTIGSNTNDDYENSTSVINAEPIEELIYDKNKKYDITKLRFIIDDYIKKGYLQEKDKYNSKTSKENFKIILEFGNKKRNELYQEPIIKGSEAEAEEEKEGEKTGSGFKTINKVIKIGPNINLMAQKLFYDNILSIKDDNGYKIKNWNNLTVSDEFITIVFNLINKTVSKADYDNLSNSEQNIYDRLLQISKLNKDKNLYKNTDGLQQLKNRFEILEGELLIKNNNPDILKELSNILYAMKDYKAISSNDIKTYLSQFEIK
jgi:hypothetical protein